MLVAELELDEADVVAVLDLQVGRIRAAKRVKVQTRWKAEFVDEIAHSLPQIAVGHQSAFLGGEQVVDWFPVAGEAALDPVSDSFSGPVEDSEHRALFRGEFLGCPCRGVSAPDPSHRRTALERCGKSRRSCRCRTSLRRRPQP